MIWVCLVFCVGLLLSGFFSGSETGFYRATRTRFALDALSGDPISKWLIRLTNNPTLFVATTLIGNNFANYLTSWAIVAATGILWTSNSAGVDLLVSVLMSPVIFVYGELMPKNLFFAAPNRLLRTCGPIFLVFALLFSPLAAVLFALGRVLESLLGESPERLQLRLARRELQKMISEGHDAGVLQPTQRQMADGMFELANMSLDRFAEPLSKLAVVREEMLSQEMLRIARGRRSPVVFVQNEHRELTGYHFVVDLELHPTNPSLRELITVPWSHSAIALLTQLQEEDQPHAVLVSESNRPVGVISAETLASFVFE